MPESVVAATGRAERRRQRRESQASGPQPATVRRVDGRGLFVELDRLGSGRVIGPARYGPAGSPPTGTRCLVLFADAGVAEPWVVAFDGWPAP